MDQSVVVFQIEKIFQLSNSLQISIGFLHYSTISSASAKRLAYFLLESLMHQNYCKRTDCRMHKQGKFADKRNPFARAAVCM